jgi:uncharacterized membrane protein YgdD (TMEM256/DUF423 family)
MTITDRRLVIAASLLLMIGVAAGAFGAHALKRVAGPDLLSIWQTAVQYHLIHALGMLGIAALGERFGSPLLRRAGALMFVGVLIFSGSLYALTLSGATWLGAITPLGGLAFIAAWAMTAWAALRSSP